MVNGQTNDSVGLRMAELAERQTQIPLVSLNCWHCDPTSVVAAGELNSAVLNCGMSETYFSWSRELSERASVRFLSDSFTSVRQTSVLALQWDFTPTEIALNIQNFEKDCLRNKHRKNTVSPSESLTRVVN